jgi:uncharacterized phage protein gp47/JayE
MSTGFIPPTYEQIRADIVARWKATFGANADTASDTVDGLIVDLVSLGGQKVADALTECYNQGKFGTATGLNIDAIIGSLFLNYRRQATATQGELWLYGADSTVVPALSEVATIDTGVTLRTTDIVTIADGVYFVMVFDELGAPDTITTTIGAAVTVSNTPAGDAEFVRADVAFDLLGNLNVANVWALGEQVDGRAILLVQKTSTWSESVTGGGVDYYPATLGYMEANNTGPQSANAGTVTRIVTPVAGWEGCVNIIDATVGRLAASDAEYKSTHLANFQSRGATTGRALAGKLLQLDGVTQVRVYQNTTDFIDAAFRPAHSYEAVVLGGEQNEIAETIWLNHDLGIETYGGVAINVIDEQGYLPQTRVVRFSRPTYRYAWARLTIAPGEGFPDLALTDIQALISGAMETWGNGLGIGRDVPVAQVIGVVVNNLAGVSGVGVELATTVSIVGPPSYGPASLTIGEVEISVWSATRVEVILT